jgi:hypothetical protein
MAYNGFSPGLSADYEDEFANQPVKFAGIDYLHLCIDIFSDKGVFSYNSE